MVTPNTYDQTGQEQSDFTVYPIDVSLGHAPDPGSQPKNSRRFDEEDNNQESTDNECNAHAQSSFSHQLSSPTSPPSEVLTGFFVDSSAASSSSESRLSDFLSEVSDSEPELESDSDSDGELFYGSDEVVVPENVKPLITVSLNQHTLFGSCIKNVALKHNVLDLERWLTLPKEKKEALFRYAAHFDFPKTRKFLINKNIESAILSLKYQGVYLVHQPVLSAIQTQKEINEKNPQNRKELIQSLHQQCESYLNNIIIRLLYVIATPPFDISISADISDLAPEYQPYAGKTFLALLKENFEPGSTLYQYPKKLERFCQEEGERLKQELIEEKLDRYLESLAAQDTAIDSDDDMGIEGFMNWRPVIETVKSWFRA